MKTPISYYGGKQRLVPELLKLIPEHVQYVEPFIGGAALFFAKSPSQHECINDFDLRVANFWDVLKTDFEPLQKKIQATLHHEQSHKIARDVLKAELADKVEYAWAFWVQCNMSFSNGLFKGFAFGNDNRCAELTYSKGRQFTEKLHKRFRTCEIFCRDAIDLILLKDDINTFFYFDPPYPESQCGHYDDKKEVYYRLLDVLPLLKSKWLLSSYPGEQLSELRLKYDWNTKDMDMNLSVSGKHNEGKRKTECLTWNYIKGNKLFDF